MGDALHDLQLHQPRRQQTKRPSRMTLGRTRARQLNQLRLRLPIQLRRRRRRLASLALDRHLRPVLHRTLAQVLERPRRQPVRLADLLIRPTWAMLTLIGLQQHLCPTHLLHRTPTCPDECFQFLPLIQRQRHHILLRHAVLLDLGPQKLSIAPPTPEDVAMTRD